MTEQIRISAKSLGELALPKFCPRCFWTKLKVRNRLPFQIFPGIFSSIDSYNKRIVYSFFDKHGEFPEWMKPLGDLVGYKEPPHFSKFQLTQPKYNVLLTGSPDGIFLRRDGGHVIVDYKTARYTGAQDELFPMYDTQLNVYALLGNHHGYAPVTGLALVYMEPVTDDIAAAHDGTHRADGFVMRFRANVHEVRVNRGMLEPLVAKTREIFDRSTPPVGLSGCGDCDRLEGLLDLVQE